VRIPFEFDDRVESISSWLHPDAGADGFTAAVLERHPVNEGLGDRLKREVGGRIARLADLALDVGDGDAEPRWVRLGELGDIVRELSSRLRLVAGMKFFEGLGDFSAFHVV